MRNLILLTILALAFTSCQWNNQPLSPKEKMVCGRWMVIERRHNRERFDFSADREFQDLFFSNIGAYNLPKAVSWQIKGDQLALRYKMRFFFIVPVYSTENYHITTLNDSVMVIASRATRRYASRIIALRKMKLNGKLIGAKKTS